MPHGSTRSDGSSPPSPNAPSVVAPSSPPPTSSKKSTASSALTTQIHNPSCGLLLLTPSSRNSRDFVSEFPGQNTRGYQHWSAPTERTPMPNYTCDHIHLRSPHPRATAARFQR